MFKNILKTFLATAFAAALSGCAAVPVIYAVGAADREEKAVQAEATLKPFVEFVSVETDKGITASTLRGAKVFTAILENDMKTVKSVPSQREKELSNTVMEEMLHSISILGTTTNIPILETLHIEFLYVEDVEKGRYAAGYHYRSFFQGNFVFGYNWTEGQRNRLIGIRKGADVRLTLRRGDTVLMEARGFWGGNDKADEIAGARQLAREVASEVIKKLSASSAPPKDTTAERGSAMVLDK